jgi:hypothetical protein
MHLSGKALLACRLQFMESEEEARRPAMTNRKDRRSAVVKIGGSWMRDVVVLAKALHYGHAAQRDERNGFPYTAAMEWRHAAELSLSGSLAAEYYWGQWERIMHLPRQLAAPIGSSRPVIVPPKPASARFVMDEIPLATAA